MRSLALLATAAAVGAASAARVRDPTPTYAPIVGGPYDPMANSQAVVVASDNMARFTVLTPRLIRMEQARVAGRFEDRATLAVLNRNLTVPPFSHSESGGVLTITTAEVALTYAVGAGGFSASTLSVKSLNASSAFGVWHYGDPFPGNLLGTVRGLDNQNQVPLNCTVNSGMDDNGEPNHCEWGLVSRDGWTAYNDTENACLGEDYWWDYTGLPAPNRTCAGPPTAGVDAAQPVRSALFQDGLQVGSSDACCAACQSDPTCVAYVWDSHGGDNPNCWPLAETGGTTPAGSRAVGYIANPRGPYGPQFNVDAADVYGFFHGHDYYGALFDYTRIGGKAPIPLRAVAGVWWSRWLYQNQQNLRDIVEEYAARDIPLSTFVIDMQWHRKNDWSGFTFDEHVFPYPTDAMQYLTTQGLAVTLNIHDASGVNPWEALYPQLLQYLGLPANTSKVAFNLLNSTVAYAVDDIVLGDLIYNKSISFWWLDWQQGGSAGGMEGFKQNPTIWTAHLRCTDRARKGDNERAMVLARWGGMGHHRYQVGFSGDVGALTWDNMAYQPYFSATSANVAHPFWSHDLEGPANDLELYVRWMQIGAFSGITRSHDRGMSGGGCSNSANAPVPAAATGWGPNAGDCSVVEPWNAGPVFFEAVRGALQARETLTPYIYNGMRSLFDSGVGTVRPMYYDWPEADAAYAMDAAGNSVQYMFGPSLLFSPVVTAASGGDATQHLATKSTWLPDGVWYDAVSGSMITATGGATYHSKGYALAEIPLFARAGAVVPYIPIKSLPTSIGIAARQYTYLGWRIYPGAASGSGYAYEDDGHTVGYLSGASVTTTLSYTSGGDGSLTATIASAGAGYPEFPASRAYQIRVLNGLPPSSVTVNGVAVPFVRFGALAARRTTPPASQWYYDVSINNGEGIAVVVDIVGASTSAPVTVVLGASKTGLAPADMSGVLGAIAHANAAKYNLDLERTTPGANTVMNAYVSVLASTGEALELLAGDATRAADFASAVRAVPGLLVNASAEISANAGKSPRAPYSLALLANAA